MCEEFGLEECMSQGDDYIHSNMGKVKTKMALLALRL
jgi:hypothetical protein